MPKNPQPLGLENLLKGRIIQSFNAELVEAQAAANAKNCQVKVTLEITIAPPGKDEFGAIKYKTDHKLKRSASQAFTTEVNEEGLIVYDGSSPLDVKQVPMELGDETETTQPAARVVAFGRQANNG